MTGAADTWGADRVYPDDSFMFQCHLFGYQDLTERLPEGARVLDLACGDGYGSAVLAARAGSCVGMDLDPHLLAASARRYRAARFVAADAFLLPFADGCFDAVAALQVVEHVADTRGFLEEIARVLSPEGVAYLTTPNIAQLPRTASKEFNPHHLRDFTPTELRVELEQHFGEVVLLGQMLDESLARTQRLLAGAREEWKVVGRVERVERIVRRLPGPLRVRLRRALLRAAGVPAWPMPEAEAARAEIRAADFHAAEPAEASGCTIALARFPLRAG